MNTASTTFPPRRISDLVKFKTQGADVRLKPTFDIVPVDFTHRQSHYQAYIFLCRYRGSVDGTDFEFRKCYARGCPNNLCQHVAQAVLIANRHLARDYKTLQEAGIDPGKDQFTLEGMMVKFDDIKEENEPVYTIYDFINMAKSGQQVKVNVELEEVPAVEHFDNRKNAQTFFFCDFQIEARKRQYDYQRCLACYATDNEKTERELAVKIANARLENLYQMFQNAGVKSSRVFFK